MNELEERLRKAIRPLYLKHLDHSIKQLQYDQQAGAMTPDQTRAEAHALKVAKEILTPMGFNFINVVFRPDFQLLVQAGPIDEESITINFLMSK